MLNTLYPPHYPAPPTSQLTDTILNAQRNAYFRYIQAVDKNGKSVLRNLENSNKRAGDHNGWSVVRDIVDVYLRKSNAVIEECISVKGPEDFETKKRADSGVSFGSSASHEKRPSTSHVTAHSPIYDKPLPAEPGCAPSSPKKQHSTFGRLARELRRIKSKSADSKDEFTKQQPLATKRSLRKMQSTSALNREANSLKKDKDGKHSRGNSSDRSALYEINDAQRQRLIQKARLEKEKENRTPSPPAPRRPLGLTALHTQQSSFVSQLSYSSQLSYGSSHPPSPPSAWGGQERTEYFTSKTFPPRREGNPYELPIEELMIAELP